MLIQIGYRHGQGLCLRDVDYADIPAFLKMKLMRLGVDKYW
jgi:hypothetical protein